MICVSIAEANFNNCLKYIKQYDFIELRLDAASFSIEQIKALISSSKKSIATYRSGNEDIRTRLNSLIAAIDSGARMIDLEIDSAEEYRIELIKYARAGNCSVILSYHNFEKTPGKDYLEEIMDECYAKGADIAKIACQVNSQEDNARLLSLYTRKGRKVILGMGKLGRITRISALYLGAEFTFAAADNGTITASGQLTFGEFQNILNIINPKER